jgi:hypothetical protein
MKQVALYGDIPALLGGLGDPHFPKLETLPSRSRRR